jgi:BirA family transcriptional regulator, biotin operon repressor / biotin---[acetyl-CoA-carboxylase] ligase
MDQTRLLKSLSDLPLGAIKYFDRLGSTNDEASAWAAQGAPDLALVIAEEQTAGRGRQGRSWVTVPGASLALSLVIYPSEKSLYILPRLTALGALAVKDTLEKYYGVHAQIKWPNDVLVQRRKLAGVLAEAQWMGDQIGALILGIGINIAAASVSTALRNDDSVRFPATYIESILERPVDRLELLHNVVAELLRWRPRLASPEFLQAWEASLAFRGEHVQVITGQSVGKDGLPAGLEGHPPTVVDGMILGLAPDGSLKLRIQSGEVIAVRAGEVRLRLMETSPIYE